MRIELPTFKKKETNVLKLHIYNYTYKIKVYHISSINSNLLCISNMKYKYNITDQ